MYSVIKNIIDKEERICAGIMSGTSLDGLDIAICSIRGCGRDTVLKLLYFDTVDYTEEFRQKLLRACSPETSDVRLICSLNKEIGTMIGQSIVDVMKKAGISMTELDFVASHGQTVFHMPEIGATLQIGEGADIAAITGVPVVSDFRVADMAYGGQGAPLAPFFDYLMCSSAEHSRVLINTGGIANITAMPVSPDASQVMAFDTGPANVISDNLMKIYTKGGMTYDRDGAAASKGHISDELLKEMVDNDPYIRVAPPKSTGRELYTYEYAERLLERGRKMGLEFEDIVATAVDFTAYAIEYSIKTFIPYSIDEYYLSGGGFHNPFLRERLEKRLGGIMRPLSELGFSGDAKEACFFAIFGNEFLNGRFNNIKNVTGADRDVIMGKLSLPSPV